ncbi:MAG: helix-turn-helix domain-containing protein, partial [Planctomycetota bacterium]
MDADRSNTFGHFFKEMRLKTELSLRQFCMEHSLDPGNVSRIERGIASPPQSREKLAEYASYLGIEQDSDDWYDFFDYAAAATGRIPQDVMSDEELVKKLPVVFRTLRGQALSAEKLRELAESVRTSERRMNMETKHTPGPWEYS